MVYYFVLASNIFLFVSTATPLHSRMVKWVRDVTPSKSRTTWTNLLTAASRESQVLNTVMHVSQFVTGGSPLALTHPHSPQLSMEFPSACTQSLKPRPTGRYVWYFQQCFDGFHLKMHQFFGCGHFISHSYLFHLKCNFIIMCWHSFSLLYLSLSLIGSSAELSIKQHSYKVSPRHWKRGRLTCDPSFEPNCWEHIVLTPLDFHQTCWDYFLGGRLYFLYILVKVNKYIV